MTTAISNLSATWSNSAITYNAISMNVATNAYESNSKILILKANGVPVMTVDASGIINAKTINLVNSIAVTQTIVTSYTTPGIYTHTANAKMIFAEVYAVGGGGASPNIDGGTDVIAAGGGGGGGGTCITVATYTEFGTTADIVVGAGGTANARSINFNSGKFIGGNNGGTSTVTFSGTATALSAGGGFGSPAGVAPYLLISGPSAAPSNPWASKGGQGGIATGGKLNFDGANGFYGIAIGAGTSGYGGKGGGTYFNPVGGSANAVSTTTSLAGKSANAFTISETSYGVGAGAGACANSGTSYGTAGANGMVTIIEYISI